MGEGRTEGLLALDGMWEKEKRRGPAWMASLNVAVVVIDVEHPAAAVTVAAPPWVRLLFASAAPRTGPGSLRWRGKIIQVKSDRANYYPVGMRLLQRLWRWLRRRAGQKPFVVVCLVVVRCRRWLLYALELLEWFAVGMRREAKSIAFIPVCVVYAVSSVENWKAEHENWK